MRTMLEARNVHKKIALDEDNVLHILRDVDLRIGEGEFVSVMGPSGSGKSTLLYTVSGMDRITSGSVRFMDQEIGSLKEEALSKLRLEHMGFIFQDINLLKNLSLIDNIMFPALLEKHVDKKAVHDKAKRLMEMTGIATLADNSITQASGGQLQRAGICRALINEPAMIFGDEPTGALDSKSAAEIMTILAEINSQGTTVMLVTHDMKVAAKTQRVLYMVDGCIIAQKHLGPYVESSDTLVDREQELMNWLVTNGF
ncbi:MAG: ABC transporter ATP-binding protein [Spirochaetae bacterium HGW-Spirochaetae-2]|nr:MAG: ABC transporter ATP-binding protein [Spirochaetae bacterium HGW-Spirochaetae-2]